MRKVLFIFIALLLAVSACTERHGNFRALLQQADGMLRVIPDSACCLLQRLKECPVTNPEDSAYLELLLLEAEVANNRPLQDTAAIRLLAACFAAQADTLMLARAHRLLAVAYRDLGHIHYRQRTQTGLAYPGMMADSAFHLAALSAMEVKDTSLWISSLISRSLISRFDQKYEEERDLLSAAWDLAVKSGNKGYEMTASKFLCLVYAELGAKEASFAFAKRLLALGCPEQFYRSTLGNAYQRLGIKDSADYYLDKGQEMTETMESAYPDSSDAFSKGFDDDSIILNLRQTQMQLKGFPNRQHIESRHTYIALILLILVTAGIVFVKINGSHLRRKEELQRKKQELSLLQRNIEVLSANAGAVFDKINQIVEECQCKGVSQLRLEEADWRLLQFEMDKRWNNAISLLQEEYHLTANETRLLCLNLLGVPTSHIPYFFERTLGTIYNWNRQLCSKLGITRNDQKTFKEDFKNFIENRK